jgi:hypothetical protein
MKQQPTGSHIVSLGHFVLIPSQSVFVFTATTIHGN